MTGKVTPSSRIQRRTCSASVTWSMPGMTGTFAARAICLASILSPMRWITSGGGPIQVRPASITRRANAAFSARKPQPAWMASASLRSAASMIRSMFR